MAGEFPRRHPGRSLEAPGNRRPRGMAIAQRRGTEPGLQAIWLLFQETEKGNVLIMFLIKPSDYFIQ